jgi:mono/diheme cytochrome c family protein
MKPIKSHALRHFGLVALAGCALALAMTLAACNTSSTSSSGGSNPAYTCTGPGDTLCIDREALIDSGTVLYDGYCTGCHGIGGKGTAGGVPPHANADFFLNNKRKTIEIVLGGYSDSLLVNGLWYNGGMPSLGEELSNREVASLLSYMRAILNDSIVTNCNAAAPDGDGFATCTKTARTPADIDSDSVAVWEVKAVRDSMLAHPM